MKKRQKIAQIAGKAAAAAAICGLLTAPAWGARTREVIPMGVTAGIRLNTEGVTIVGLAGTDETQSSPGQTAGLRSGDVIVKVGGETVTDCHHLQRLVDGSQGQAVTLTVRRDQKEETLTVTPVKTEDGGWRLGIWVRDSMLGIGTLTFYDPESGMFAALGHGVCAGEEEALMKLEGCRLVESGVRGVRRGLPGEPGELMGDFNVSHELGVIWDNTPAGLYGRMHTAPEGKPMPVAREDQIQEGAAQVMTNVEGCECALYDIRILRMETGDDLRDLLIQVTDPALLERTGGIVQGMSGSPILQNGRIVGAVTHVLINDPTRGYGILIHRMLDARESVTENAA